MPDAGGDSDSLLAGDGLKQAIKTIRPVEDLKALPTKPCTRESLLYGIGTGAAMGGIRMLSARVPIAANWAVGTFVFISGASMYICTKAREEEQRVAQAIIKKFPQRNIRLLAQKRAVEARANETTTSPSSSPTSSASVDELPPELRPVPVTNEEAPGRKSGDTPSRAARPAGVADGRQGSTTTPSSSSSWWSSWTWGRK